MAVTCANIQTTIADPRSAESDVRRPSLRDLIQPEKAMQTMKENKQTIKHMESNLCRLSNQAETV